MLPAELVRKVRKIEITTNRVVQQTLAGQYHSVFRGRGMAFSEVRPYQPGDEIRSIDWNVTARMNEAYVKVFVEERELTVMILVDRSASGAVGSREKTKNEVAAEIAALIALSATQNNDRVGLVLFTDRVERFVPAKKGRSHALRIVSEVLQFEPASTRTDVGAALEFLRKVNRRKSVAFVVSDFLSEGYERALRIAGRRHDLVPIVVADPIDDTLPDVGLLWARDAETGEVFPVDTSSRKVREAFAGARTEERKKRDTLFRRLSLDSVAINAGEEYVRPLVSFFRARARRMRT